MIWALLLLQGVGLWLLWDIRQTLSRPTPTPPAPPDHRQELRDLTAAVSFSTEKQTGNPLQTVKHMVRPMGVT